MIPAADPAARAALHVTNGDATVPGLRAASVRGEILTWRDVLHEGPVPDVAGDALRCVRAEFLARAGAGDLGTLAELTERDRALEAHEGDFVLWFEADLYDQLQLIQVLTRLAGLGVAPERITLAPPSAAPPACASQARAAACSRASRTTSRSTASIAGSAACT